MTFVSWRRSGLSVAAFCRSRHLNLSSFYRWRKHFDNLDRPSATRPRTEHARYEFGPSYPFTRRRWPTSRRAELVNPKDMRGVGCQPGSGLTRPFSSELPVGRVPISCIRSRIGDDRTSCRTRLVGSMR